MTHRSAFFLVLALLGAACASSSTTGDAPAGGGYAGTGGGHAGTGGGRAGTGGAHASGGSSSAGHAGMDPPPHDVTDAGPGEDAATDAPVATDAAMDAPEAEDAAVDAPSTDDASVTGVPTLAVGTISGATSDELVMIASGVTLANDTMKTDCFRAYVLSASWTETNGLTQQQIWDQLCSGTITVNVDMYLGSWYENHVTKTIGYEAEPGTVHMNRYFVDTPYMVADNLIHEGEGHSQGFRHDGVKATSVPYGLNDAFEACSPVGPLPMHPQALGRAPGVGLFLLAAACEAPFR